MENLNKKVNSEKYLIAMEKQREKQKEIFFMKCSEINGNTIDISNFDYKGNREYGKCKCKICGYEWEERPETLYKRKLCPQCQEKENNINKRKRFLKEHKEKADKLYKDKNISDIEFFYDEKDELRVKFICHEKYCDGTEHGEQIQTGHYFLKGKGCGKCASHPSRAYTTEEWVRMAKDKYPEFSYEKTVYVNKVTKVIITCPKHGDFEINPKEFLYGKLYCPKCTKERLHDEFVNRVIERAKEKHKDDDYIYHSELIIDSRKKMGIECKKHGIFWQDIANHTNLGTRCPECVREEAGKDKRHSFESVIERAKKVHNNKYTYHKDTYISTMRKTLITCPEHGDFEQTMHSHLAGQGCPKCAYEKIRQSIMVTQEDFIERVKYIHRNKGYDFSKTKYEGCDKKVSVICPKHGEFKIKALGLLQGQGCQICRLPKLETAVRNALLENNIKHVNQKRFKSWLGGQSLDFYIPEYNVGIECQGMQHFKEERRYNNLKLVQERDERKKRLCKENGVHLIYYVPDIFSQYMKEDDIYFTNTDDLIDYIKNYNCKKL